MIVRSAKRDDAASIVAIWNPLIETTATTFTTQLKDEAGIQATIADRAGAFWVAEVDGSIIGFATYFQFRSGPGYARTMEHSINLSPSARGHGAGRALMQTLEEHARSKGVHSLWAGISAENESGIEFHTALGFIKSGRLPEVGYKFGRWMDLILMHKLL